MIWAYEELGWGGYWGWDPVENAGLLPWFTATAFLHSVMVQERRSMLRVWNVTLVIITFFLTIFGTFMTRSGVVQSVHAFGEDRMLAWLFSGFMVITLVFSFGLVIYRLPLLKARNELDSWVSREAAFLLNNWILLFSAMFVLFATMFPTISEALTGDRLSVGPPFFTKWMLPIGLVLLLLTGLGPLLAWRKTTVTNLRDQFMWPTIAGVVTTLGLVAVGLTVWGSLVCFALSAFTTATIVQEFWRGGMVRSKNTGTDVVTAIIGLVGRNKRRYGGYIVHMGIVLMFFGFAGEGYKRDEQVLLKPGQQTTIGRYTLRNDGVKVTDDGQKQMVTGHIAVFEKGKQIDTMYPAKWFYRKHEEQPTSEVAIRRGMAEDLYLVLPAFELQDQSVSLQIVINPLVDWIWVGFGVMALGTGIALLPEGAYSFAVAKAPGGSVTAGLLLCLLLAPVALRAQEGSASQNVSPVQRSELRRQLEGDLMCMCGCRAPMNNCPMGPSCHGLKDQQPKLEAYIAKGMTRDEIKAAFAREYGEQILLEPPNKGFNRLAWAFPYLLGASGIVLVGLVATRWTRKDPSASAPAPAATETVFDERLDDELRNLD